MQEFQEIPLGDHGDLGKLPRIQPYDLFNLLVDLPLLSLKFFPVRQKKAYLSRLFHQTHCTVCIFPFSDTHIFRISPDRIFLPAVRKHILHIRICIFSGILAAHHIAIARSAAGPVIERIGDGVKYGSLPCTRIAGDQEQAALHLRKIYHFRPGIRSESGHCKPDRSHLASPFTLSNTCSTIFISSFDISRPCISRKKSENTRIGSSIRISSSANFSFCLVLSLSILTSRI